MRKTRGICFSDSGWAEVRDAAERQDFPVVEFVREGILEIVRGRAATGTALIPADLTPLIERTFRYVYVLATLRRDDLVRERHGEEMEKLVRAARELQDSLYETRP